MEDAPAEGEGDTSAEEEGLAPNDVVDETSPELKLVIMSTGLDGEADADADAEEDGESTEADVVLLAQVPDPARLTIRFPRLTLTL